MKVSQVKSLLESMFSRRSEFEIRFESGWGDESPPKFIISSNVEPCQEGYEFKITVKVDWHPGGREFWSIDLNGFMRAEVNDPILMKYELERLIYYTHSACPEQELKELKEEQGRDDSYYY